MESETNMDIREILEMYGIDHTQVIGNYNLIGHLRDICDKHAKREFERRIDLIKKFNL